LIRAIVELGADPSAFVKSLGSIEDSVDFYHSVPTIDVLVTLGLRRDNDLNRPIHRNDIKDVEFLSVAVPYCNIVVTERFWSHTVRAAGLDRRYDTIVISDLTEVPELLARAGCF
jgi:hypothetical protein